jgi:glycerol-3-phosphate dehydrogenase
VPPVITAEETVYLCEGASAYFARGVTPADVVWSYSGVRPLIDDGSGKPEAATRGYSFEVDGDGQGVAPILSVFGGKITTYRELAREALDRLAPLLPVLGAPCRTADRPLPGGDFAMTGLPELTAGLARDYPFLPSLDAAAVDRIARAYGTDARRWLGAAQGAADLGQHFGAGLTGAEVDWMIAREWARDAEDVLWRRSKLGLRLDSIDLQALQSHIAARLERGE